MLLVIHEQAWDITFFCVAKNRIVTFLHIVKTLQGSLFILFVISYRDIFASIQQQCNGEVLHFMKVNAFSHNFDNLYQLLVSAYDILPTLFCLWLGYRSSSAYLQFDTSKIQLAAQNMARHSTVL